MFCFVVLLVLIGAGFYFYQKLIAIEAEIRSERNVECPTSVKPQQPETSPVVVNNIETEPEVDSSVVFAAGENLASTSSSFEAAIVNTVTGQEGMKQTALYPLFPNTSKKQIQQVVKEMADNGILRREKKGSSYLLYVA